MSESKINSGSGWRSVFVDEVRRHMRDRGIQYAVLVVEAILKVANGYMVRFF